MKQLCISALTLLVGLAITAQMSAQTALGITAQGTASQPDVQIGNTGSIQFQNNASFPVAITFTTSSGAVFANIANVAAGHTSTSQTAQQLNVTVNYTVTNLNTGQVRGPYGIEVGSGPIRINISRGLPDLDTVSIPTGGQIQFNSDATYGITWVPANVLSPVVTSLQPGLNPVQTSTYAQPVSYTITSKTGTGGTGTVKVNS